MQPASVNPDRLAAELRRLDVDLERGAISGDDYKRFRERLTSDMPVVAPPAPLFIHAPVTPQVRYARWGRRLVAQVVDGLIVLLGYGVLLAAFEAQSPSQGEPSATSSSVLLACILLWVVLYDGLMVGRRGQTIGKMLFGIKVVAAAGGGRVSYARAIWRSTVESLLNLIWIGLLSYLWPLWDGKRQTFHDKLARTVVVED